MGYGICIRLEKKNEEGKWESMDYYTVHESWVEDKDKFPSTFPFFPEGIFDGRRNDDVFTLLGGERRSCPDPIVEARGIPDSANHFIKDEYEACKDWMNNPSWLTLGELRKAWYIYMDNDSNHDYDEAYYILLNCIIRPIEKRLEDLWFVSPRSDAELEEACRKYWDTVRIVFWFE